MSLEPENDAKNALDDLYARRLANQENIKRWYYEERAKRTVEALQKNGFTAFYVEERQKARQEILKLVPDGATVGVGGSITIRQLEVLPELAKAGHRIYDHWVSGLSFEEVLAIRRAQLTCDVFLSSANALTSDGQIVCGEGIGNRVCAMTFGPPKVIIAVGVNKITGDLNQALRRVKELAAPLALKETGVALPCLKTGYCHDCEAPQRGCRITLILERKPFFTDTTVIVIGEALGF
ncbi:lactate utilization protein [Chloroflexota bacterium]